MRTIVVEHLARVEGHGGITVELEGDTVGNVRFDVFEGARLLEPLVRGKRYDEVAPALSRICAICSVAHSLTSLKATENAFDVRVSQQTELLRELLYLGESIESHALHLFLLALPDY
ncbi:MAG: nickel-dependent hydrogenase large subunit [Bryobacteraceae bacterium]